MASLDRLPSELIIEITKHLCESGRFDVQSLRGFYGLSLASRRLHAIFNRHLWSTYSFYYTHPCDFLSALMRALTCAAYVKRIYWDYTVDNATQLPVKIGLPIRGRNIPEDECQGTKFEKLPWCDIKDPADQRLLDIMLNCTPNLEQLGISETFRWDDHRFFLRPILEHPKRFARLKSVVAHGPLRLENIRGLLTLPSMRRLELTQVITMRQEPGRTFEWETTRIEDAVLDSPIEELYLHDSVLRSSQLVGLLQACRALKTFCYNVEDNDQAVHYDLTPPDFPVLDYEPLAAAVRRHRASLQHFRFLDCTYSDGPMIALIETHPFVGFIALRTLELGQIRFKSPATSQFLALLPATLHTLRIVCEEATMFASTPHGPIHESIQSIHGVVHERLTVIRERARSGHLPNLRTVTLSDLHPRYDVSRENARWTKSAFEEIGIQFNTQERKVLEVLDVQEESDWMDVDEAADVGEFGHQEVLHLIELAENHQI